MFAEEMSGFKEWKEAWDERAGETIGFDGPLCGAELEEHNRKHTPLGKEKYMEELKKYQEGE